MKKGTNIILTYRPLGTNGLIPKLIPSAAESNTMAAMYRPLNNLYMNKWYLKKENVLHTIFVS